MIQNVSSDILPTLSILTDQISLFPSDFDSGFDCFLLSNVDDVFQRFKYRLLIGSLIPWAYMIAMVLTILLVDKIKNILKRSGIPRYVTIMDIITVTFVATFYNFYFYVS
jgi:hypothetical protein